MYVRLGAGLTVATLLLSGCVGQSRASSAAPVCHAAHEAPATPTNPLSAGTGEVTIPALLGGTDVTAAYARLHGLGLKVAFTKPADVSSLQAGQVDLSPPGGAVVPRGSTVEITPQYGPLGSPAVDTSNPRYRIPNLIGCSLSQAIDWIGHRALYWSVPKLPSPRDNSVAQLFDGYRVVGQEPKAGATLGQGVTHGNSYRPTPLTFTVAAYPR